MNHTTHIFLGAKPDQSIVVDIDTKGVVAGYHHIKSQIKLVTT